MKRFLSLLLCISLMFAMTACGVKDNGEGTDDQQTESQSSEKKEGSGLVGITTSMYTNEGLAFMCDNIKEALEAEGYTAVIKDANLDQSQQTKDVEDFINQGAELIIIEACDSVGVKSALEMCKAANIPALSFNQILEGEVLELATGSVTSDNYQAGYEVGQEVAKQLNGTGKICILTYDVAFVCRERGDGFKKAMEENSGIEILEVFDGVCTEDDALKKTEDWLQQYPDISAIFGNNTNCGIGIGAAMRAANKVDDILVANVDGQTADLKNMEDGALDITAVYPMRELAEETSAYALDILKTGKCSEDPHLKFSLCTQDQIEQYKEYWGME